jgi:hypothetical protein
MSKFNVICDEVYGIHGHINLLLLLLLLYYDHY